MNNQKATLVQIIAAVAASLIGLTLAFAITWCAIWKIYIDASMQMLIGTILGGVAGSLTTILVGRSIPQLNKDEPIPTEIKQPPGNPVPVVQKIDVATQPQGDNPPPQP